MPMTTETDATTRPDDDTEELFSMGFKWPTLIPTKDYERGCRVDYTRILSRQPVSERKPMGEILVFLVVLIAPNRRQRFDRIYLARTGGKWPVSVGVDAVRVETIADTLDAYLADRDELRRRTEKVA